MSNSIENNIRKNYLKDALKSISYALIFFSISYIPIKYLFTEPLTGGQVIFIILLGLILLALGTMSLCTSIKNFSSIFYLNKTTLYKEVGGAENLNEIIEQIQKDSDYEDNNIIISKDYLMDKNDYRQIVKFEDILAIYENITKVNNIPEKYIIVVVNKYNEHFYYSYSNKCKELVPKLITIISSRSKNAKVGYTKETLDYIKNNIIENN